MLGEHVLTVAGFGLAEDEFGLGDSGGLELRGGEQRQREDDDESDPDRARTLRDRLGDPRPQPALGRIRRTRRERPEYGAADGHECGRQEGQCREHRHDDADRRDRAEGARRGEVGQQEDEESGDDGSARGGDRFEHTLEGAQSRTDTVGFGAQGVAEARDDEEGIVGGGTDDEDEEDPLDLPVDEEDAGIGEVPDDEDRGGQSGQGGEEDDDRQQRRAVDDDEDDEDGDERDEQEDPVDAGEGFGKVGGETGRSGDIDVRDRGGETPALIRGRVGGGRDREGFADGVPDPLDIIGGGLRGDREDDLEGVAIIGGDERRGVGRQQVVIDEGLRQLVESGPVVVGDSVAVFEDDDGRNVVEVAELLDLVLSAGRFGGFGQEGRAVVRGDLGDLAEVRTSDAGDADPGHEEDGKEGDERLAPADGARGVSLGRGSRAVVVFVTTRGAASAGVGIRRRRGQEVTWHGLRLRP